MSAMRDGGSLEARHLRVLVALAEEGGFTDAAIRLRMSQPAVSRSLARLEAILGVRLVERTTRALNLTDAGRAAYRAAVSALLGIDAVADAARGLTRPLRLGYGWAAFGRHTSIILRTWRDERPDLPLEVHRVDDRSAGLAAGLVDLAIRRDPVADPALCVEPIFAEPRLAAVAADSPLASRQSLTLADLARETVAITPVNGTTTVELWPADGRPRRVIEAGNIDEWLLAIASGAAVGVTPESTRWQHPHPGVRFVPLPGVPTVTASLVWAVERPHPAAADFVSLVRRCVADG